ncbi:hypothetical protein H0H92_003810 [Tricholoma furcatifolium]|nr:hypothetical protein H0H92_003810 [Tricholoma furcatifolium]
MPTTSIWCLLINHENCPIGSSFEVSVERNMGELKERVKEKRPWDLEGIDPAQLAVWRCRYRYPGPCIIFNDENLEILQQQVNMVFNYNAFESVSPRSKVEALNLAENEIIFLKLPNRADVNPEWRGSNSTRFSEGVARVHRECTRTGHDNRLPMTVNERTIDIDRVEVDGIKIEPDETVVKVEPEETQSPHQIPRNNAGVAHASPPWMWPPYLAPLPHIATTHGPIFFPPIRPRPHTQMAVVESTSYIPNNVDHLMHRPTPSPSPPPLKPPHPVIPMTTSLDDALRYWDEGDAEKGLTIPLKEWPTTYKRDYGTNEAVKFCNIRFVRDEFLHHCNGDFAVFEERYPNLRTQWARLIQAVRRARQERGEAKHRSSGRANR